MLGQSRIIVATPMHYSTAVTEIWVASMHPIIRNLPEAYITLRL